MSENEAEERPTEAELDDYEERRRSLCPDQMIAVMVAMANKKDIRLGVTLSTGGDAGQREGDGPTGLARRAPRSRSGTTEWLEAFRDRFRETVDELNADDEDDPMPPYDSMIHLTDARFVFPDGTIPRPMSTVWRGRQSQVDGWTLGEFGAESNE